MKNLKPLVKRNIQIAKIRKDEALESNPNAYHFWDGYISALESIVHVLPNEEEQSEEILQAGQSSTPPDNCTPS